MSISGDLLKRYGGNDIIGTGGEMDMDVFFIEVLTLAGTYTDFWIKEFQKKLEAA